MISHPRHRMLVPPTLRRHCSSGLGIKRLAAVIYIWKRYPAVVRRMVRTVIFDLSLGLDESRVVFTCDVHG